MLQILKQSYENVCFFFPPLQIEQKYWILRLSSYLNCYLFFDVSVIHPSAGMAITE